MVKQAIFYKFKKKLRFFVIHTATVLAVVFSVVTFLSHCQNEDGGYGGRLHCFAIVDEFDFRFSIGENLE